MGPLIFRKAHTHTFDLVPQLRVSETSFGDRCQAVISESRNDRTWSCLPCDYEISYALASTLRKLFQGYHSQDSLLYLCQVHGSYEF